MKSDRQTAILTLIQEYELETQEELAEKLQQAGYQVTQATVSRDIRELRLTKVVGESGRPKYAGVQHKKEYADEHSGRFIRVLQEGFLTAQTAGNILVIKTVTGMAMAVAAALDNLEMREIVGCIAGDDTIFVAVHAADQCVALREKIQAIVGRQSG